MKLFITLMALLMGSGGAHACSCIPYIQSIEDEEMGKKVGYDVLAWMKRLKTSPNIFSAKVESIDTGIQAGFSYGHRILLKDIKLIQGVVPDKNIIYNASSCPAYLVKSHTYLFTVDQTMVVGMCGGVNGRSSEDEKNAARAREALKAKP
jgi:hypothetical protein